MYLISTLKIYITLIKLSSLSSSGKRSKNLNKKEKKRIGLLKSQDVS